MKQATTLSEPSAFVNDWYGWLTNQVSHIGLGVFLTFAVCVLYWLMWSEMPYKTAVYAVIFFGYVAFEVFYQGWRSFDTIEDTVFTVGYGAASILSAFSEVTVGDPKVGVDVLILLPFFIVACIHLLAGVAFRIVLRRS